MVHLEPEIYGDRAHTGCGFRRGARAFVEIPESCVIKVRNFTDPGSATRHGPTHWKMQGTAEECLELLLWDFHVTISH